MSTQHPITRTAAVAMATSVLAVLVAACGGSPSSSRAQTSTPGKGSTRAPGGVAYSRCMRSQGVTNFPDPSPAGGYSFSGSTSSPAFESAERACANLIPVKTIPNSASATPQQQARYNAQLIRWAKCMRHSGYPLLPDPTPGSPQPGEVHGTAWGGGPGWWIDIPRSINAYSSAFSNTAKTCDIQTHQTYR
ncbi:MAG TPA: hypothetical protein VHV75_02940 [Solirubrobacteraceae bacterium]|nr:hypothetical protein [Solirubrobacteraceae bacterium]